MYASDFEWVYGNATKLPAHKKEMIQACHTGNLSQLQQIYQAHNIQPGAELDWMEHYELPTTVYRLLITAILYEHIPILQYLLFMHPKYNLYSPLVVHIVVDRPNLEMMELIHKHQPDIINFGYNYMSTFLTDTCRGDGTYDCPPSNKTFPLIHYLLDNGADPRWGSWRGEVSALDPALAFSRPLEILDKMIDKGATVNYFVFFESVRRQRVDTLVLFFEKATFHCTTDEMLHCTRETKDKATKAAVKAGVAKLKGYPKWWEIWK